MGVVRLLETDQDGYACDLIMLMSMVTQTPIYYSLKIAPDGESIDSIKVGCDTKYTCGRCLIEEKNLTMGSCYTLGNEFVGLYSVSFSSGASDACWGPQRITDNSTLTVYGFVDIAHESSSSGNSGGSSLDFNNEEMEGKNADASEGGGEEGGPQVRRRRRRRGHGTIESENYQAIEPSVSAALLPRGLSYAGTVPGSSSSETACNFSSSSGVIALSVRGGESNGLCHESNLFGKQPFIYTLNGTALDGYSLRYCNATSCDQANDPDVVCGIVLADQRIGTCVPTTIFGLGLEQLQIVQSADISTCRAHIPPGPPRPEPPPPHIYALMAAGIAIGFVVLAFGIVAVRKARARRSEHALYQRIN